MFSGEYNPKEHLVSRGKCLHCGQAFSQNGIVYTKDGALLTFVPEKSNSCREKF